jgi:hypothetical protein
MQVIGALDARTIVRLKEQDKFLLRMYHAEFAKDPASPATESSRSHMMALRHTLKQLYGESVADLV